MLAVYQYSLEKVDGFAPALEAEGIFDPDKLAQYSLEEVFLRLEKTCYKRGELNAIFTDRLRAMGKYVKDSGKKESKKVLTSKDKKAIENFLKSIKGVGHKITEKFFTLRGL